MPSPFEPLFADYAAAFDAFDAAAIASFYHCPCLLVNGDATTALTSEGMVLDNMQALVEQHRSQRAGRALASIVRVENLAPNLATVGVGWQVFAVDGALLWEFGNTYDLADYGEGWKILTSIAHAAPERGSD